MDLIIIGEMAAIATACLWTINSILFASAGRRIGAISVNAYRIAIAVVLLAVAHLILLGTLIPLATDGQWFWIGASGVIGLGIGDFGLFAAFVMIGPRRSILMMSLSPIFAAVGAYVLLGETLSSLAILGMAVTLAGVIIVIREKEERSHEEPISREHKILGVSFAFVGAACQGIGLVLAKKGIWLEPDMMMDPLSATLMRMLAGALFIWICVVATGRAPELRRALKDRKGMSRTAAGAIVGPVLGVTLSMVAVSYIPTGVAQTMMSLMPVLIIPTIWILYGQKTSWRGIVGAMIAVIGVAILFLI